MVGDPLTDLDGLAIWMLHDNAIQKVVRIQLKPFWCLSLGCSRKCMRWKQLALGGTVLDGLAMNYDDLNRKITYTCFTLVKIGIGTCFTFAIDMAIQPLSLVRIWSTSQL